MSLLLDTHAFLWWLGGIELADGVAARISSPYTRVAVSVVSAWEAAIKEALGQPEVPEG